MTSVPESLLWPVSVGPENLAEIERVPLRDRGLPTSTYELLRRAAKLWPTRPAVSVMVDGEHWDTPVTHSFSELAADVHRAAGVLIGLGVGREEAVAVISVNCAELLSLLLAAEAVSVYAPINPALSVDHAAELVRLSGARVVVASGPELDGTAWSRAREVAERIGARALLALRPTAAAGPPPVLEPLGGIELAYLQERMSAAGDVGLEGVPPTPEDTASFLHTGGTTGAPKLAARTHANEVANAWMIASAEIVDDDSVFMSALPLFHTNALVVSTLAPLLRGQHVVWAGPHGYRDRALYANFWKIVERYRISTMASVPTTYAVLAGLAVDADISTLKLTITGAAPLPVAVRQAFKARTGLELCQGYGLTEGTCASARDWPESPRPDSVGQRLPYQEARTVAIDDGTGEWTFLRENEIGTLVLRGPNVFAGYVVRGPSGIEFAADGKVRDGWLDTGDLASVDGSGYIRLVGRAKDLIIRGGHNIDPATIEDALLENPEVISAAAVGRPDPHAGEVPVAFVALAPGSKLTADELKARAAERVPERAAAPQHVEIVDEIPLTAVGKQYKPELRRRAAEQAAREALAGTVAAEQIHAVLIDRGVEIQVPHSAHDAEVRETLARYAWSWTLL
jgi:fatty-acyl-CoA synthase